MEGTLLMLDDMTPHVAVPVQAIRDGKVIDTVLSDEAGRYHFVNLEPGAYQVRCQVLGGYVYYGAEKMRRPERQKAGGRGSGDILTVESGKIVRGIDFCFAGFKKGTWKHHTYLDGLADNYVYDIHCDPDGIMWFATTGGGVSRYDGKEFVNFTTEDGLANNDVWSIYCDPDGVLWFGTGTLWTEGGGVSRYDGKEFVNFTIKDGLADDNVFAIHGGPDGTMWFGTRNGVSRYDGKTFVNFTTEDGLAANSVLAIHRDPDGIMWFGTRNGGASRYDGKEFINFTTEDGLAGNVVWDICRAPDGTMWFGTQSGVSRYDGKRFVNLTTKDGLASDRIFTIYRDLDGIMWFGTGWANGYGVSRYDGKTFVNFTTEDGLATNNVLAIHRDPDGVMWFGTHGGGISRYDGKKFVNLTTKDGLAGDQILSIYRDPDGIIWFGTCYGVSQYNGKGFVNFTTEDGLAGNSTRVIYCDADGTMWFGTCYGVSQYNGKRFTNFTTQDGLVHNDIWVIYHSPDGVMWFGTWDGVSRYDGKEFVNFTTKDGLAGSWVRAIHCDADGTMWFGTWGGVSVYDGDRFVSITKKDGLAGNNVNAIYCDTDGALWFGAKTGGVSRYDGKEFVNLTTRDGLAGHVVSTIYGVPDGVMWFGTHGGGVSGYDGIAWTSLDTRDGLAGDSVNSILQDPDGTLWFGADGGITRYQRSVTPPRVYIVSITTDQTYRDVSDIPALTPGVRVTIEYSSVDFRTVPEKRQYRCQVMEGDASSITRNGNMDLNWQSPTRKTSFDWVPDKMGTYTFAVQAIDCDLNYSKPATLSLTVQPDPKFVSMQMELNDLRQVASRKYHFSSFIGESAAIRQVHALMERAIDSGLTVLITGETGTGKELVARAIHHNSPRKDKPILGRNCGAIPGELLTSELFGHRKGAFTGANEDKMGLFEAASGGTVQLDEIGEMPQDAQIHLLRFLEEREVQRLGENISRHVDVRIIATTNRDLAEEVTDGGFREDLYYRLSEFPIHIPPLRERREDIPVLAEHFLKDIDKEVYGFAPGVLEMLQGYSWPGNVRELRNVIRRAAALAEEGKPIQTYHFPPEITQGESLVQEIMSEQTGLSASVENLKRRMVENALRKCNGNRTHAAEILGIDRPNLVKLIKRMGLDL